MTARAQDIGLGAFFCALGLAAAFKASDYRGATGIYPMSLGLVIAAFGLLIALRAALRGRPVPRPLIENGRNMAIVAALSAAYLALMPVLGFYVASFTAGITLPFALGYRRPLAAVLAAAVFVAVVWMVFAVILQRPLPGAFWAA